ncbi:hypothetical protein OVS_03645 [Mycoplasma ovis str. Michigan]|uniref:Uncharacterized protein n=1 Tax=Mycoplasma ovis str. Michigan TaxID=1415773 RepID=A0ABN4BNK4_9MOLU|nr:hypothetical protein [Mycoplasma ovis]AHC40477.1 hypothetical protein OVS_03645 [Mycoplasma ovis str. Michigan]
MVGFKHSVLIPIFSLIIAGSTSAISTTSWKVKKHFPRVARAITKHSCYKWIIDRETRAEIAVCPKKDDNSPIFYLWWLKEGDKDYNGWLKIEKITKVEADKSMTVKLQEPLRLPDTSKERTICLDKWEKQYGKTKNLDKLVDKTLSTDCQIKGGNILECSSGYKYFRVDYFDVYTGWLDT